MGTPLASETQPRLARAATNRAATNDAAEADNGTRLPPGAVVCLSLRLHPLLPYL